MPDPAGFTVYFGDICTPMTGYLVSSQISVEIEMFPVPKKKTTAIRMKASADN